VNDCKTHLSEKDFHLLCEQVLAHRDKLIYKTEHYNLIKRFVMVFANRPFCIHLLFQYGSTMQRSLLFGYYLLD